MPIGRGYLYLVAVMDWASRAVLAWRLSHTMDASFCVSALEQALVRFGRPEIFDTDQGSQFTSATFTAMLAAAGIRVSMEGRGRCTRTFTSKDMPTAARRIPPSPLGSHSTTTGRICAGEPHADGGVARRPRP
jgi:transposase InsO family protein